MNHLDSINILNCTNILQIYISYTQYENNNRNNYNVLRLNWEIKKHIYIIYLYLNVGL